jgi:ribosomal protein L11 methyltransferase
MKPPSRWLVVEVRRACAEAHPDVEVEGGRLAEALLDLGGRAVEESDGWLRTHLDAADRATFDVDSLRARLEASSGLRGLEVRTRVQAHEDWSELWKRGLEPRRVGRHFIVSPSWCEPDPGPDDRVLVLDPGMAFGNAEHGTTRGCLRLLEDLVEPGQRLLDVGTGSGVLAIAAARLGAARVRALESDPWAVEPAVENVRVNGVSGQVEVIHCLADVARLAGEGPVDGIVANIEVGVLTPLLPGFRAALRQGGWLILSGILAAQLDPLVEAARAQGFALAEVDADGEWRSVSLVVGTT